MSNDSRGRRQFHNIPALKSALEIMNRNEGKPSDEWSEDEKGKVLMRPLTQLNTENV